MKKIYLLFTLFSTVVVADAQVFWTEDFGTGCNQGQLASAYAGTNGAWTISSTGTNDATANTFYIGAQEAGNPVGACGTGCVGSVDATLHIGNVAITLLSIAADGGASYFSGVASACSLLGICATTNKRAESPIINCTGQSSISISFAYLENGATTLDDASLWYSADGGTTWSLLNNMAKTPLGACAPQGTWTAYSFPLPASANNNATVKIGFNWTNNDDGLGTDPSFAVDDISLSSPALGVAAETASSLEVFATGNIITIKSMDALKLQGVYDVLGRTISASLENNTINMEAQPSGIYFVRVEAKGQVFTKKVFVK